VRSDQHGQPKLPSQICSLADRCAAHRRSEDGTLQLAGGPPRARRADPADRGHRSRALDRGERRADPRRPGLARARLDEGPVSQAARAERHEAALARLLESGAAYRDPATAKDVEAWKAEHGAGRGYRGTPSEEEGAAVRLRVPEEGETVVEDLIRGPVSFPNASYDDFVIARGDGSVLYNFAVAVDDAEMGVTEVVRGDDHLSNTPKQLLVLAALGHEPPRYAHLPLLHGPDGKKLSKRHGAASVQSCARPATCRRRCATTWPCSAGGPTTTRP